MDIFKEIEEIKEHLSYRDMFANFEDFNTESALIDELVERLKFLESIAKFDFSF